MKKLLLLVVLSACAHRPVQPASTPDAAVVQLFQQGVALAREGDLTRAEEYLAAAHRAGGHDAKTLSALLGVCVRASRLRSVLAYAAPYLQEHPAEPRLWLLVASVQLALGQLAEAQRSGEHALVPSRAEAQAADTGAPHEAAAHYLLGRVATALATHAAGASRRKYEAAARAHFERSLALAPDGRHGEELRASLHAAPSHRAAALAGAAAHMRALSPRQPVR